MTSSPSLQPALDPEGDKAEHHDPGAQATGTHKALGTMASETIAGNRVSGDDSAPVDENGEKLPTLPPGSHVGRYMILSLLGSGAMGVVYAAYDPGLDRKVALKLLHPSRQQLQNETAREAARARLMREAHALAKLSHPNVVAIHDVGLFQDQVFLAMEFVEGQTLSKWLRAKPRQPDEVIEVMRYAGRGLAAAHEAGLTHRDFKPDNVLIGTDGRVRVLDFGLARSDDEDSSADDNPLREAMHLSASKTRHEFGVSKLGLTRTGALVGTPAYMSPEQHLGDNADARSDQFSFCVALYEALYGQRPFSGKTLTALAFNVIQGKVEPPSGSFHVSTKIRRAVLRGLNQTPDARFPSMLELLAELETQRSRGRFGWLALAAISAGSLGLVLGSSWLAKRDPCTGAREHLAGVWDAPRKQLVHAAFSATKLPYAENVWQTVEISLDAYTNNWVAEHTAACEATRVTGEQSEDLLDLRMMCLDRRLTDLRALTDLYTQADAKTVEFATQGTADLPELAGCNDVEGLKAAIPPPTDPEARGQVKALREQLATARALDTAGRWDEGIAIGRRVEITADALAYPPVQAEARLILANLLQQTDDRKQAVKALYEAIEYASFGRDDHTVARAWIELVFVAGIINSELEEALWCSRAAEVALARTGDDPMLRAHLQLNRSAVLNRKGDPDAALPDAQQALAAFIEKYGENHPQVHRALSNLGLIYKAQQKWELAEEVGNRAVAVVARISGESHPGMVALKTTLSHLAARRGDHERAKQLAVEAVNLAEQVMPEHTRLAQAYAQLAGVYQETGETSKAYAEYQKALTIQLLHPEKGYAIGVTFNNLAYLDLEQKKLSEAEQHFAKALPIFREAFGETHPHTLTVAMNLAEVVLKLGQPIKALDIMAQVEQAHRTLSADDPALAESLTLHGEIYLGAGDPKKAEELLSRAMAVYPQVSEPSQIDPELKARTLLALARALSDDKRSADRVATLAQTAQDLLKPIPDADPDLVRDAKQLLQPRPPPSP